MKTAMKLMLATAVMMTAGAASANDYHNKSNSSTRNYREYNRNYTEDQDIKYDNMSPRAGVGISDKRDAQYGMQRGVPSRDMRQGYSGTYMGYKVESYANPGDVADSMHAVRHAH